MPAKKTTPKKRLTKGNERSSTLERNARTVDPLSGGLGKGASSLQPLSTEQLTVDYKAGVIMAITFPLALIFFWKVTLPVTWFVMKTALGEQLVLKLNYFKQDVFERLTSECPSWIPAEERSYLDDRLSETLRRIPSPKTQQEFEDLIELGEPLIITDAMKGWESFGTWDCDSFTKEYKDADYFDWQADVKFKLSNISNRPGYEGMKCAAGYIEPFWPENSKYVKDWMKKMSPLPSFLPSNALPDDSPITGFIGVPGTGVSPHLDETCDTLMTAQFSGVKNWSMSWPVKEDGVVKWRKPVVFTLYPGDMMFWYTNMRHHTEVVHGCSLSFSFRIHTPAPKLYLTEQRKLISDLSDENRYRLYEETQTRDKFFLDKCHLVMKYDQVFLN
ncbi:uncharacterized protein LOC586955 [Strongylocentrotus purpuratus]|uniref:Uncharacterized protein n=1 Tax=Strongylocentrotus purpuratus TaxID=7668 RepID=A0A7M7N3R7_STRPU|nr:uncharacterized protein LOC586955 [Strongylocentrotus purpuratus]